jgi:hypothetical protein
MLWHYSEDPTIAEFVPHTAATARQSEPYVWAVDDDQAPAYWFPRQCPRALAWALPATTDTDRETVLGGAGRVHAIEYGWLAAMSAAVLYRYPFDAAPFRRLGDAAWVAEEAVRPLGPAESVGDLFARHDAAGIELRLVGDLRPWWSRVVASTVGFSGIRLRNARHPM